MKILAIGTSNNQQSINRTLAAYTAGLVDEADVQVVNIADYELPLFSEDRERFLGQPELAQAFYQRIGAADALVIAFAEHNGSYTAAWKNLFDWVSRINRRVFQDKPTVYLSTSPGPGGAANVLASAVNSAPHFGVRLVDSVSVPSFHDNFDGVKGTFHNPEIKAKLQQAVNALIRAARGEQRNMPEAVSA